MPATAGLVMFVDGDLAQGAPTPSLTAAATAPLPDAGDTSSCSAAPAQQGLALVRLWDEDGNELEPLRIEVGADRGYEVPLPRAARLMQLTPERTSVSAVVLATGDGADARAAARAGPHRAGAPRGARTS